MTTYLETQRCELARAISDAADGFRNLPPGRTPTAQDITAAEAILAAGYRKPRTVTRVEELDALPEWSVVRSEQATIWEKLGGDPTGSFWAETLTTREHPSGHIALPATVLWEPEA